jgi:hypothetical protein
MPNTSLYIRELLAINWNLCNHVTEGNLAVSSVLRCASFHVATSGNSFRILICRD